MMAAIHNGADAVYFGLQTGFNARFRAANFLVEDLSSTMTDLHRSNVKGYVTLNTLVFSKELPLVEELLRRIVDAGVDAVLVQDLGVARLARRICPELPLHASTQMTLTCAPSIELAATLGIQRVVLPRETSLDELQRIRNNTAMPLEVFVHGALCVAYSGQCLTSESLGGRSANRGQCAQACRLPYQLICDGEVRELGSQQYLLSPLDLATWELVPKLVELGVASLKIEGRLKAPEYVAATTSHYRRAVDAAMAKVLPEFTSADLLALEQTFSRGFSHGWMAGCNHKELVPGLSSAKRGVFLGRVIGWRKDSVTIELDRPQEVSVVPGDGVVFSVPRGLQAGEATQNQPDEQGGRVYSVTDRSQNRVELQFQRGAMESGKFWIGQPVWKSDDPQLNRRLRSTYSNTHLPRRRSIRMHVVAIAGKPLKITVDSTGLSSLEIESEQLLVVAQKHSLTETVLQEQFARLGKTPFVLESLTAEIVGEPMMPLSVLGKLRHQMVRGLESQLSQQPRRVLNTENSLATLRSEDEKLYGKTAAPMSPRLWLLCRRLDQLRLAIEEASDLLAGVYLDFQDPRDYGRAAEFMRDATLPWWIATLRIQLPSEAGLLKVLKRHRPSGFLVRHFAAIAYYREHGFPLVADFSLNAANDLTTHWLLQQGVARVTASYDLNREQLHELVQTVPPATLEVVIHQRMPMFHMQHCVFCAVLSPGTNKSNCGRPCDRHQVGLVDRVGKEHPLTADVGCRNTLFNGTPQSGAEAVPTLMDSGVRDFRVELLSESPAEGVKLVDLYLRLLQRRVSPEEVWRTLKAANRIGVTRGTLEDRPEQLDRTLVQIASRRDS